jgi:hypothetical protein
MSEQLLEEPRLILGEADRNNHVARRLDDMLRHDPVDVVYAAVNLGGIVIHDDDAPHGAARAEDIRLLDAAIQDTSIRRISFDDGTEDALDADEGLQALISQMQQHKGVVLGKKQARGVEDNPQAIEDRNTIWCLRIASLALRRMEWNAQNQAENGESRLPMAG